MIISLVINHASSFFHSQTVKQRIWNPKFDIESIYRTLHQKHSPVAHKPIVISVRMTHSLDSLQFHQLFIHCFIGNNRISHIFVSIEIFPIRKNYPTIDFEQSKTPTFHFSQTLILPHILYLLHIRINPKAIQTIP